jgi:predicted acyltransferase (DUF342 family)
VNRKLSGVKRGIAQVLSLSKEVVGTAFAVKPICTVVTCAHVINNALNRPENARERPTVRIPLKFPNIAIPVYAIVVEWHPSELDVAILELEEDLPRDVITLTLGQSENSPGNSFYCYGFPVGHLNGLVATGTIVGFTLENKLQIKSGVVTRGFSGAPILDKSLGLVTGMVQGVTYPDELHRLEETALAITSESIQEIYPKITLSPSPRRIIGVGERFSVPPYTKALEPIAPKQANELSNYVEIGPGAIVDRYVVAHEILVREWAIVREGLFAYDSATIEDRCVIQGNVLAVRQISLGDNVKATNVTAPTIRLTGMGCEILNTLACNKLEIAGNTLSANCIVSGAILCGEDVVLSDGSRRIGGVVSDGSIRAGAQLEIPYLIAKGDIKTKHTAFVVLIYSKEGSVWVDARAKVSEIVSGQNVVVGPGSRIGSIQANGNVDIGDFSTVNGQVNAKGNVRLGKEVKVGELKASGKISAGGFVHIENPQIVSEQGPIEWVPPLYLAGRTVTKDNLFIVTSQNHLQPYTTSSQSGMKSLVTSLLNHGLVLMSQDICW